MIFQGSIPPERQNISQKNYNRFITVNGFAYMCLGETIIILQAVQMNCPDWIVSTLGSMPYFGYVLLPLGKTVTARVGAARSQHLFWVYRNIAAFLVATAMPIALYIGQIPAICILLTGTFFFYGFRAAGFVMSQPLIGEITNESNRAQYISNNSMVSYASGALAIVLIGIIMFFFDNIWIITGVVVFGAMMGVTASEFLKKVDETNILKETAARPLFPQIKELFMTEGVKRLFFCFFVMNLAMVMLVPISMLTLKRGCGVSDSTALAFSFIQWISASAVATYGGRISKKVGSRKVLIVSFLMLLIIPITWLIVPGFSLDFFILTIPFIFSGVCTVTLNNAMTSYYLEIIVPTKRVAFAMLSSTLGGVLSGLVGMVITGTLLTWLNNFFGGNTPQSYRVYFIIAAVIILPWIFVFSSLKSLPIEKRNVKKAWLDFLW